MTRSIDRDRLRAGRTPSPTRRLVLVAVALTTTLVALLGTAPLLPPPPIELRLDGSPFGGWGHWLHELGPAGALMALIRVGALALTGYLLLVVTLELLALVTERRLIGSAVRLGVAPWARRLVRSAAGLGVATSIVAATLTTPYLPVALSSPAGALTVSTASPASGRRANVADLAPTMHRLDADPTSKPTGSTDTVPPPTMHRLDADPPPTDSPSTLPPSTLPPSTVPDGPRSSSSLPANPSAPAPLAIPTKPSPAESSLTWTIAPGDHLWGVAAHTLASAWGRSPSDAEVDRYLGRLIAQNRSVLAVPDDPDLVLPGQVFVLVPIEP